MYAFLTSPYVLYALHVLTSLIWTSWWRAQIMKLFIMPFSPAFCYFICLRSKWLLGILPSCTLNLCSSSNVWGHTSYTFETTRKIIVHFLPISTLSGFLATTAWCVLGFWMEGMAFRYGYRVSSRRQPTSGGLPAWGFGTRLTTHYRKKIILLRNVAPDHGWLLKKDLGPWSWLVTPNILHNMFSLRMRD